MNRLHLYNGLGAGFALLASLGFGALVGFGEEPLRVVRREQIAHLAETILPDGQHALRDASGALVPLIEYHRIASATTLSDAALWELCEHQRIVAYTARSRTRHLTGYRYADKPGIEALTDVETMLTLKPDLLFVNHYTDPGRVAHLRSLGIAVFDLGEMRGLSTLGVSLRSIARLLGRVTQGEHMLASIERGMHGLSASIPSAQRPRALYLSSYGNEIYGAGDDTSYHDILVAAGLRDAASGHFRDFPVLGAEQVLTLDPDLIVTKLGMAAGLCDRFGLQALRACKQRGSIIELDAELLDDPGAAMLEAAETLFDLVHQGQR